MGEYAYLMEWKALITLFNYFLWKVMRYVTFALLLKHEQGLIVWF